MSESPTPDSPTPKESATCDFTLENAGFSEKTGLSPGSGDDSHYATGSFVPGEASKKPLAVRRDLPVVPGYDILDVLGQGAMGVVYKARQHGLKRLVALKMILSGAHARGSELARFQTEAESVARLRHPHIVQVHGFGEWHPESGGEPLPYLALEYIDGGSLAKYLRGNPQPPRFAAELVRALAGAIQYAHDHQVIHRDLKPGNILLEGSDSESLTSGTVSQAVPIHETHTQANGSTFHEQGFVIPKIADFGLAKQLDEQSSQTVSGAIVGTPSYMAPEQASGDASRVGPSADIYALGAVLYEMLTGRPPFRGTSLYETLDLVRHTEPVPPSRLQPKTPLDLETICLKCLQKEPAKRYATALALSDDLRRFLANEPIHARPIGKLERTRRWCARNPFPAFLIGLVGLTLLVGLAVSISLALWAVRGWTQADEQTRIAKEQTLEKARRAYVAEFYKALQKWEIGRIDEVQEMLSRLAPAQADDPDLRSFEWNLLQRQCHVELRTLAGHEKMIHQVACSPDGRWLATAGHDNTVRIWDRGTGNVVHTLNGPTKPVICVAFSPDSKTLASAGEDSIIRIWEVASGKEQTVLKGHTGWIRSLVFRPDGAELASGAADNKVRLWDLSSGQSRELLDHAGAKGTLVYGADGKKLYSAGKAADVLIWDVGTGQMEGKLSGHNGRVNQLAISADGRRLASYGQDQRIRVWDTATGVLTETLEPREVECIALSPDGKRLVTGGTDRVVRVWNLETRKEVLTLRGHMNTVFGVTYSPDGWQILSAGGDKTVKIWDAAVSQEKTVVRAHPRAAAGLAFSSDSRRLATCGFEGAIHIWDPEAGIRLKSLPGHRGGTLGVCFLPDSDRLASVGEDDTIRLWDVESGKALELLHYAGHGMYCCACSPDARWLAAYADDGTVLVYDLTNRTMVRKFACAKTPKLQHLCFHPTEPWLAIANYLEYPVIRNVESGELVSEWKSGEPGSSATAFSPDGRWFVANDDLSVWDLESAKKRPALRKTNDALFGITFSRDGRRVIAGGLDPKVRVWDVATGSELLALAGHTGRIRGVALSNDGLLLASVGEEGVLQIWDARPLTPERRELREAASLVRFLFGRVTQREEVLKQIRQHLGISESVRGRALEVAEAYQQDAK